MTRTHSLLARRVAAFNPPIDPDLFCWTLIAGVYGLTVTSAGYLALSLWDPWAKLRIGVPVGILDACAPLSYVGQLLFAVVVGVLAYQTCEAAEPSVDPRAGDLLRSFEAGIIVLGYCVVTYAVALLLARAYVESPPEHLLGLGKLDTPSSFSMRQSVLFFYALTLLRAPVKPPSEGPRTPWVLAAASIFLCALQVAGGWCHFFDVCLGVVYGQFCFWSSVDTQNRPYVDT